MAILIENQPVGNHILVSHRIKTHGSDGMQGKEPTACLVYSLSDEIGWIVGFFINQFFVLKRIMKLCVWHSTRIKPHINQICFAMHWLSAFRNQHHLIRVRAMQIEHLVVRFVHVSWHEIGQWIFIHQSCRNRLFAFSFQLFCRTDAFALSLILC